MTKEELVELIIKEFKNKDRKIDLSGLDFGEEIVNLSELKAKKLSFSYAEAEVIMNCFQKSTKFIDNRRQEAGTDIKNLKQKAEKYIYNYKQECLVIKNWGQDAKMISNNNQKAITYIENINQVAVGSISNKDQKSAKIFN